MTMIRTSSAVFTSALVTLAVGLGPAQSFAQQTGADFSGLYVGVRSLAEPTVYPFTADGQNAYDQYDPTIGDPRQWDDCEPEGIPPILLTEGVATMELTQQADRILVRLERDDARRTIFMDGRSPPQNADPTALGYSVGHWENDVLVIETTNLTGGVIIAQTRYPRSPEAKIVERYSRESGEYDLHLEVTTIDPQNYTEPVTIGRDWTWSPDAPLLAWNCVSLGPRGDEPLDIDELRRALEGL
jgi:hypothetical protein